jgi:hypothetical protein
MRKTFRDTAVLLTFFGLIIISSCYKDHTTLNIVEPITVVSPDSLNVQYVSKRQIYPINIVFTTDRPLAWVKCMYEYDTTAVTMTYPDTLFYVILDTIASKLSNKYTYTGSYRVPDTLPQLSVVRFNVTMFAKGNPSDINYPNDTISYNKQFKMVLR